MTMMRPNLRAARIGGAACRRPPRASPLRRATLRVRALHRSSGVQLRQRLRSAAPNQALALTADPERQGDFPPRMKGGFPAVQGVLYGALVHCRVFRAAVTPGIRPRCTDSKRARTSFQRRFPARHFVLAGGSGSRRQMVFSRHALFQPTSRGQRAAFRALTLRESGDAEHCCRRQWPRAWSAGSDPFRLFVGAARGKSSLGAATSRQLLAGVLVFSPYQDSRIVD